MKSHKSNEPLKNLCPPSSIQNESITLQETQPQQQEPRQLEAQIFKFEPKVYKWSISSHRKFCIVGYGLGWDRLLPKQVQKFLPHIDRLVIQKHLNKTKKAIKFLEFYTDITNLPKEFQDDPAFLRIVHYWKENKSRMPDKDIFELITD
ncbi:Conserved_hypothetical protein [Hexamita inflata]|uniref:LAGLIDADG homing endonuclease n=1 Tax=Hexamita inflata TaxID=28002 RepID=A0ABP1GJQ4_9EUKA